MTILLDLEKALYLLWWVSCRSAAGQLQVSYRSAVGQQQVSCRLAVGQLVRRSSSSRSIAVHW